MSSDPRDAAATMAAQAAEVVVRGPRYDARAEVSRYAPAPPNQVEQLTEAIVRHCSALPRRNGDVHYVVVFDGDTPIGEFEGGGGAAEDVARFMSLRATMEGKRLQLFVSPCREDGSTITRWRFFVRPDDSATAFAAENPAHANAWNGNEAIKLRDAHQHQLVQQIIEQQRVQSKALTDMGEAMGRTLKETTEAVSGVLKQMSSMVEKLATRVQSAESRADDAQRELAETNRLMREQQQLLDEAANTLEREREKAENAPETVALKAAAKGITEGLRIRIGGGATGNQVNGNQVNGNQNGGQTEPQETQS